MRRVRIIVEGQTEEDFVKLVLRPELWSFGVSLEPVLLGESGQRGGRVSYERVKHHVIVTLKQDASVYCTTLLDLYGLGQGFSKDDVMTSLIRVRLIEKQLASDVIQEIGELRPDLRFLPYVQMHELEGLLFSHPLSLAEAMFNPQLEAALQAIRDDVDSPEDINDSPLTAPSKRLLALDPNYDKRISGPLAAERMGIDIIKQQCPRFRSWMDRLAALGSVE